MTHLSPDGGAMSPPSTISLPAPTRSSSARPALPHPLSRMLLTLQIDFRRARLAELETEMIAACEAAALGTRSRTNAGLRQQALGPDHLASLPRRGDAAGGDLRPPHAPSSPGNRPTRTAEDLADRRLIGIRLPAAPCPAADVRRQRKHPGSSTAAGP